MLVYNFYVEVHLILKDKRRDNLVDDILKINGNMAIAWSSTLEFKVEKSSKSLIGSAVSGEEFVNVYRGTGKVLMAPSI